MESYPGGKNDLFSCCSHHFESLVSTTPFALGWIPKFLTISCFSNVIGRIENNWQKNGYIIEAGENNECNLLKPILNSSISRRLSWHIHSLFCKINFGIPLFETISKTLRVAVVH